jgi:hypothetical protein
VRLLALSMVLAACGGSLNGIGARDALGRELQVDPSLASVICGYAVDGVDTYDEASRHYLGVDARQPAFGPPEAIIDGAPIAAPGVPVGTRCTGKVQFDYQTLAQGGTLNDPNGSGSVTDLQGIVKVLSRKSDPPATLPARYDAAKPDFVIPIDTKKTEKIRVRLVWPPGEPGERYVGDFEIVIEPNTELHLSAMCGMDVTHEKGDSGRVFPTIELYAGTKKLATMETMNNSESSAWPEDNKAGAEVAGMNKFRIEVPGTYRLHVTGDCPYQMYFDR